MSAEIVGTRVSNYKVLEEIARGGMAAVYKARDVLHDRIVALKVLPPELVFGGEFLSRFQREVETLKQLRHPNIVQLYDVGRSGELHYFCMEYVPGGSVEQMISEKGKLEIRSAIDIAVQVTQALEYAHQQGIIHRDIKPANLLVDRSGNVKVTDFGIAKVADATQMTLTGGIVGTVEYLAPEQADGRRVGPRADIYSLGASLYQMVTGQVPFSGSTPTEILQKHRFNLPESPRELNPDVPVRLSDLIDRMLQKESERRPESMPAVRREMERIKVQMAMTAEPGKQPLVSEKRHAWPLVLAVVLLVGVALLAYRGFRRPRETTLPSSSHKVVWDMDREAKSLYLKAKTDVNGARALIDRDLLSAGHRRLQVARALVDIISEHFAQTPWATKADKLLKEIEALEKTCSEGKTFSRQGENRSSRPGSDTAG